MIHNYLYSRILFHLVLNFIAVLCIGELLLLAAFDFKMREIPAKHLFNIAYRLDE